MNDAEIHALASGALSADRAFDEAKALYKTDHWFSYANFAKSARYIESRLEGIGLSEVGIDPIPAENRTRYSGWTTANAWDVERGTLAILSPERKTIADWGAVPHHVIMRSDPASGRFEIVPWNPGDRTDVRGKLAFTHKRPSEVQHDLKAAGGLGIVSDFVTLLPGFRTREDVMDHVLWEQVCFRPNPGGMWGFMLSPRQGEWLEGLLEKGKVEAEVDLRTRNYDGTTDAIEGLLPGDGSTDEEVLLVTSIYEPGANDDCSGGGLCIEIARAMKTLRDAGRLGLKRGVRFLWIYEGRGAVAWMHRHEGTLRRLKAGLNLDEVGVDQSKARSTAHFFVPPYSNPSFVGELLCDLAARLLPTGLRWKPVADRSDIILDTRFSDPSVGVPTPCIIQYPALFYHTSLDTPETLDPNLMHSIGALSIAYLARLSSLSPADAPFYDDLLARHAREEEARIRSEANGPLAGERLGLLRERLEAKRAELSRWGIAPSGLSKLSGAIRPLPEPPAEGSGAFSRIFPRRKTLAAPSGLQLGDTLPEALRVPYKKNLMSNGLDLIFHHFFYWADGSRSLEAICRRVEEELRHPGKADSIPRTAAAEVLHERGEGLSREAVHLLYKHLVEAGMMELGKR